MNSEDLPPWNTPECTDWPVDMEYPSKYNPFHYNNELAINEPDELDET